MTYQATEFNRFGGVDLSRDPQEIGPELAVDLLNVDFDRPGRVRTRDGYDNLTAAAYTLRLRYLTPYYKTDGTKQFIACTETLSGGTETIKAYSTAGAVVGSGGGIDGGGLGRVYSAGVRFGTPTAEYMYIPGVNAAAGVYRWDGATFSLVVTMPIAKWLTVSANSNRMVAANYPATNPSRVGFSDAGDAETWTANNFVSITPGDGEGITALATWRELVFAFKETKFAVFTGESVGGDGNPVFNYRMVENGVGAVGPVCVGRPGVFFINRRGVYVTSGDQPRLISGALDPLFLGTADTPYTGDPINMAEIESASLAWVGERLYAAVATGASTSNDRLLVWDSLLDQWTVWNVPAAGMCGFRVGDSEDLIFSYATGSNHVGRVNSSYTTDDGTAISSFWQSGFYELGSPGADAYTRYTRVWGYGSPTVSVLTDHGTSDSSAAAVTLGTSPAVAEGYHGVSYKGRLFSHKLSASSGTWSASRLQQDVAWVRP
jgi:hypothetical protein